MLFSLFTRRPVRTPERQAEVARACSALQLYHLPTCPYCWRVRRTIAKLDLPITLKGVLTDPAVQRDLVEGGGSMQVPCLRIEAEGGVRWLYESADIITYLNQRFSQ